MFGPIGPLLTFTASFVLLPGMAAVYAPYIAALGLLARIDPGRTKDFVVYTTAIAALLFYSLCCDPLWSPVGGMSWAVPFAVVALSPLRVKAVIIRCAALGVSLALMVVSGALLYVYTLTQYTSRVYFSDLVERAFAPSYVSILFSSPYAKYYYGLCILGWAIGLVFAVGRVRVLVVAGSAAFAFLALYMLAYLLLDMTWWLPLPFYVEHSLFPLLMVSAFAGLWSTGQSIIPRIRLSLGTAPPRATNVRRLATRAWIVFLAGLVAVALVPLGGTLFAIERAKVVLARYYSTPWANEPELAQHLLQSTGLAVGRTYRGSSLFLVFDVVSMANLWKRGVPTINEYSQLVTPQASYLLVALFKQSPALNGFYPWVGPGASYDTVLKTLQAMGVRHVISTAAMVEADSRQVPSMTLPRRPHDALPGAAPEVWHIYRLPDPNVGGYSPTEVVVANSAPEIVAVLGAQDFDFRRRVVLSSGGFSLVPARDTRLTVNRGGGFHVSGKSDGVSLIILPQQFSHCLKASDSSVRIVRANLLWTGVVFSGAVDADISFAYGVFSPGCRRADIADMKRLAIVPPDKASGGQQGTKEKLQAAINAFKSVW